MNHIGDYATLFQRVPPTFEPIQVQRPFMSLSFAPDAILPDSTTSVALDPGALDVSRPCSGSSAPAQHALAALYSSWVPGRVAFVHASPMPHVHRTLRYLSRMICQSLSDSA